MSGDIKPSDDMIVLAMLLEGEEFRCADDIASTLRRLGFEISPQKMAGTLRRLCSEDSPMVEGRDDPDWRLKFYRVTRFGHCQLNNRFARSHALSRAFTDGSLAEERRIIVQFKDGSEKAIPWSVVNMNNVRSMMDTPSAYKSWHVERRLSTSWASLESPRETEA